MTIKVLKYLKRVLHESTFNTEKKLRIWAICCLLWNGSLRIHEVLSKTKKEFDPLVTLCGKDIEVVRFEEGGGGNSITFENSPQKPQGKEDRNWRQIGNIWE